MLRDFLLSGLENPKDQVSTTSLGSLFHSLTIPSCSSHSAGNSPISACVCCVSILSSHTTVPWLHLCNNLPAALQGCHQLSPGCLFSRLNKLLSLSLSSYSSCPSPLSILVTHQNPWRLKDKPKVRKNPRKPLNPKNLENSNMKRLLSMCWLIFAFPDK